MNNATAMPRRRLLKSVVALTAASLTATFGAGNAAAQKAPKTAMKYQDKPNGEQRCDNCLQFVAPDQCKILEGNVSPQGYCIAWVNK